MSGGSMNYLCERVREADFDKDTPERLAFARHLALVAQALHDIEWVDSCDYAAGDENEAIRACLQPESVLLAAIGAVQKALADMVAEVNRLAHAKKGNT